MVRPGGSDDIKSIGTLDFFAIVQAPSWDLSASVQHTLLIVPQYDVDGQLMPPLLH